MLYELLQYVTGFLAVALAAVVVYVRHRQRLWTRLAVPHCSPVRPMVGNFGPVAMQKQSMGDRLRDIYDELKTQGLRYGGYYQFLEPGLMITDPELIRKILVQDFDAFHSRGMYHNERDDPLGAHLVFLEGAQWRALRQKLTPVYTSGKLRAMIPTINRCAEELCKHLSSAKERPIEFKDLMARYTTDVIGNCAMGVECNSLKDPDAEFRRETRRVFRPRLSMLLKVMFAAEMPNLAKMLRVKIVDKSAAKFFMRIVRETVDYREKNDVRRNDMMQLLIDLKNTKDGALTLDQIAAEAFVFFVGGFETSSTAMCFLCYELAVNPAVQDKAREEVKRVLARHGGEITYEAVSQMVYLDRCISESLRKYPVLPLIRRVSNRDYELPPPEYDTDTTDGCGGLTLPSGTVIAMSTLGLHRDPEHWTEPDRFDPDRFDTTASNDSTSREDDDSTDGTSGSASKDKRTYHKYAYLPFGEGPRNCIGMRFALAQVRVGMATLLNEYRLETCDRTEMKISFDPGSFPTSPLGGIWLRVAPL